MKRCWIEEKITMKEKIVLRTILSLTLAAFLLCGCGNSKNEAPVEEAPEVASEEEVTEEAEKEEIQEAQQPAEEETPAEEEVADKTNNGMPVAKVETTVNNYDEFINYIYSLDNQTPALLIYNENEGYVINMREGEYYQLKKDDRIFEYLSEREKAFSDTLMDPSNILGGEEKNIVEIRPDYSQYDSPHEVLYVVYFTEELEKGDYFLLTCYLDAPAE